MDKFSFSVLKGIGKRPAVTIKELAAIYNRSVDYMEDPVLYLRRCGYLDIERNYAALHDLTENSLNCLLQDYYTSLRVLCQY